jgi:hypothetical protein
MGSNINTITKTWDIGSWGSSVSIVVDYRLDDHGSIPEGFFP